MLASVIIPVYNDEGYIGKLLDSLVKQTIKNFEVIVIDDKSEDNTVYTVKSFKNKLKLRILFSGKHNQSYSRNLGIKAAKSDVLINLDSDTYVNTRFIEGVLKAFKNQKIEGLKVREKIMRDNFLEKLDYIRTMSKWGGYLQTTRIFRKGYMYDGSLICFGDDFVIDTQLKGKIGFCNEAIVFSHRFHSWKDVFKAWRRYPSGFVYYRKYENVLKGFKPLFFPLISPFIMVDRLLKFKDPAALLIPFYDVVRTAGYVHGMITNPKQMFD